MAKRKKTEKWVRYVNGFVHVHSGSGSRLRIHEISKNRMHVGYKIVYFKRTSTKGSTIKRIMSKDEKKAKRFTKNFMKKHPKG